MKINYFTRRAQSSVERRRLRPDHPPSNDAGRCHALVRPEHHRIPTNEIIHLEHLTLQRFDFVQEVDVARLADVAEPTAVRRHDTEQLGWCDGPQASRRGSYYCSTCSRPWPLGNLLPRS